MTEQIEFFPTVTEDTEGGKGRETQIKGLFTAEQIDPISLKRTSKISNFDA